MFGVELKNQIPINMRNVCYERQQYKKRIEFAQVRDGIRTQSGIYPENGGSKSHDIEQGLQLKRSLRIVDKKTAKMWIRVTKGEIADNHNDSLKESGQDCHYKSYCDVF
jgi:hypothetical protein